MSRKLFSQEEKISRLRLTAIGLRRKTSNQRTHDLTNQLKVSNNESHPATVIFPYGAGELHEWFFQRKKIQKASPDPFISLFFYSSLALL
jgi:hypothetical protein